ncbi:LacI family transcriptional regulator [Flavobacterium cupreum]|uniref:LacI family transcriptional regulator n=2 Tax=Flavobacterium TaxID=237 RepID=A0A4Y7UEK2_9FLAO|nr:MULTISPECIES: substrate-binding domain-containing protein [Flavobacterium]RUT67915.1 LacI family transcriptional regulator [Flavobacterium cupreum]TCN59486.1 LacI family transcriptional regulator [Flavobacterium circumlabens]TEB44784.1 LacI family transcriptional regulator [Flavobacterium circumlabens]
MKKKSVSINTIAKDLNISITTVSFILNGKAKEKHISKKLTQCVLDYAQKLNYKPNQIAQSLRTGKTKTLVFMVEDISNYFFSKLARIIEEIAYSNGYRVVFCSNENQDARSIELINLHKSKQVDGFIIVPSPGIKKNIAELIEDNLPVILFDRCFADLDCNSVMLNNLDAAFNATNHLISNNYKNIVFITTDSNQMQIQDRLTGYKKAIKAHNLKSCFLKIPYQEITNEKSKDLIRRFIETNNELDAVFFAANHLTKTGLEVFKESNPDLIQSLGVITFDDNELFKIYSLAIIAVPQPLEAMGDKLMEVMMRLLNQKEVGEAFEKIEFNAELKI